VETLPSLPSPRTGAAATSLDNSIFLAGGADEDGACLHEFLRLTLNESGNSGWESLKRWNGPPRSGGVMVGQRGGEYGQVWLFGGNGEQGPLDDMYVYDPRKAVWIAGETPPPTALTETPALAMGQSHILFLGGSFLAFHTITDRWTQLTGMAAEFEKTVGAIPFKEGILVAGTRKGGNAWEGLEIQWAETVPEIRHFSAVDTVVLVLYLAALISIGIYCAKRKGTSHDYFLAGQNIPWWAAGLSLMATQVSAIGFMAVPAKTYATNWLYFTGVFTWFFAVPIVTVAFIPFFRRLNVITAYEYLEHRFNPAVRVYAALIFSLVQLGRMAVVLYLPALALSSVTDLQLHWCIITMGVLATVYTVAGGMAAVVWTDVVQAVVLLGGAILCIIS